MNTYLLDTSMNSVHLAFRFTNLPTRHFRNVALASPPSGFIFPTQISLFHHCPPFPLSSLFQEPFSLHHWVMEGVHKKTWSPLSPCAPLASHRQRVLHITTIAVPLLLPSFPPDFCLTRPVAATGASVAITDDRPTGSSVPPLGRLRLGPAAWQLAPVPPADLRGLVDPGFPALLPFAPLLVPWPAVAGPTALVPPRFARLPGPYPPPPPVAAAHC